MIIILLMAAMLVAKFLPETPLGKTLHHCLVEEPMRLAQKVDRRHLFYLLILLVAGQALLMAAPFELAVIAAWDMSVFMDAVLATWTAATVVSGKGAWRALASRVRARGKRRAGAARAAARRRASRPRRSYVPANDDDGRGWALAA
jgi:hypothetical protein